MLTIAGKTTLKTMALSCPDDLPRAVLALEISTRDTAPVCAALGVDADPLEWAWAGDDPAYMVECIKVPKRKWEGKHTANIGGYELRPTWVQVVSVAPVLEGHWAVSLKVQVDDPPAGSLETWVLHIGRELPVRLVQDEEPGTPDLFTNGSN